jgi:CspA family cold shock protein
VKWYDKTKGYGFIECPEGDVFFHFSDIQMEGFKALAEDQRVSYKMLRSPEGLKAKQIKPMDNRASVKSAARYRTLLCMKIRNGNEDAFDQMMRDVPAWFDEFEQDVGLRRIGTWRCDNVAVRLIESDRPYEQTLAQAEKHAKFATFRSWQDELTELLEAEPVVMAPVLPGDVGES